jgi:hypothetical protein
LEHSESEKKLAEYAVVVIVGFTGHETIAKGKELKPVDAQLPQIHFQYTLLERFGEPQTVPSTPT